jgi:hypothetical protein
MDLAALGTGLSAQHLTSPSTVVRELEKRRNARAYPSLLDVEEVRPWRLG